MKVVAFSFLKILSHAERGPMNIGEQMVLRGRFEMALANNDLDAVRSLMPTGFMAGKLMLERAVDVGSAPVCRLLLSERLASANEEYQNRLRPLHLAKTREVCEVLLALGADPDFVPDNPSASYLTPFQYAVSKNRVEIVKVMVLECGCDLSQRTIRGRTIAQLASPHAEMKTLLMALRTELAVRAALMSDDVQAAPARTSGLGAAI